MRGLAHSIRSAIAANRSVRASRRPATVGISAVSRAIALAVRGSAILARGLIDGGAEIAAVALEQLRGFAAAQSEADQDGSLHVAVGLFEIARRVGVRAVHDFADDGCCAPAELGVARPHVHDQSAISASELY